VHQKEELQEDLDEKTGYREDYQNGKGLGKHNRSFRRGIFSPTRLEREVTKVHVLTASQFLLL